MNHTVILGLVGVALVTALPAAAAIHDEDAPDPQKTVDALQRNMDRALVRATTEAGQAAEAAQQAAHGAVDNATAVAGEPGDEAVRALDQLRAFLCRVEQRFNPNVVCLA